jgi:hypothetical protein
MAEDAGAPDIDEDLVALSIVVPTEFVAARNARAKELRTAKQRDRAGAVAKLPKPTWTAWALNVLARREPDALTAWLAAGADLDAALGAGDRDALREAQQAERASLAATIELADAVLGEAGRTPDDQTAQKLTGTLRAAITDGAVRDRLVRGVLDDDVEAPTFGFGFGPPDTSAEVVSLASARAKRSRRAGAAKEPTTKPSGAKDAAPKKAAAKGREPTANAADREEAEAARLAEEAEAEARREEAARLDAERARLSDEVAARQRELDDRVADVESAEEAVRAATAAVDAAAEALARARTARDEAQAALDALPEG